VNYECIQVSYTSGSIVDVVLKAWPNKADPFFTQETADH